MTVYVTAISPQTVQDHTRITRIRWLDASVSTSNLMSVEQTIDYLRSGNTLVVAGADRYALVQVVEADTPYIRTVADGAWTDNLLSLPRF